MKGLYRNDHVQALQVGPDEIRIFGAGEYSRDIIYRLKVSNNTLVPFTNIKQQPLTCFSTNCFYWAQPHRIATYNFKNQKVFVLDIRTNNWNSYNF